MPITIPLWVTAVMKKFTPSFRNQGAFSKNNKLLFPGNDHLSPGLLPPLGFKPYKRPS
jgi:hypothetical protein